ncbi:MAG: porin [Pseudomonadales bacterium]|nr:porin [Pseudomonadales bacterium]
MKNRLTSNLVFVTGIFAATEALAIDLWTEDLRLTGFATVAASTSDVKRPYYVNRNIDDDLCYSCDSVAGLQLDYQALDNLRFSAQGVKRTQDKLSNPVTEWIYAAYRASDNIELRAGRLRTPLFLTSTYYYVGNAYPWLRPNSEVYNRQFGITAFDGIELLYEQPIGDIGTLSFQPFYGGEREMTLDLINRRYQVSFENIYGAAIDFEGVNYRLHFAYQRTNSDLIFQPLTPSGEVVADIPINDLEHTLMTIGIIYEWNQVELWLEAVDVESTLGTDAYSYYIGAAWNLDKWVPYAQFAQSRDEPRSDSDSATLGLRYNIMLGLSLQLDATYTDIKGEFDITATSYPLGQFVVSPYMNISPDPRNPVIIEDGDPHDAMIWSLGLNWMF